MKRAKDPNKVPAPEIERRRLSIEPVPLRHALFFAPAETRTVARVPIAPPLLLGFEARARC
jgi:hypothetical protein